MSIVAALAALANGWFALVFAERGERVLAILCTASTFACVGLAISQRRSFPRRPVREIAGAPLYRTRSDNGRVCLAEHTRDIARAALEALRNTEGDETK